MWQSMLMATPIIGSARTIGISGLSHSNSDLPKVRNLQTQASYRLPEKFRSIALYPKSSAIRVSDSSTTDLVSGNFDVNGNNNGYINPAKKRYDEMCSVLDLLSDNPSLESKLDDMKLNKKLNLDEELVTRVVQSPDVKWENLIGFVKWAAECDSKLVTKKLLDDLRWEVDSQKESVYTFWDFLQEAVCRYNVSTTTKMLNEVISMFSYCGEGMAAYLVFNNFENLRCEREAESYYLTIKALYNTKFFNVAGLVCEKMITGDMLPDEEEEVGEIIDYLCQGGRVKDAFSVYKSAREKEIDIPRKSLRCLVYSLCTRKNEDDDYVNLAVQMFHEIDD